MSELFKLEIDRVVELATLFQKGDWDDNMKENALKTIRKVYRELEDIDIIAKITQNSQSKVG